MAWSASPVVEAKSVNSRHLAFSLRAPSSVEARASALEADVRARLARGSVSVSVSLDRARVDTPSRIVPDVLRGYLRQLESPAGTATALARARA